VTLVKGATLERNIPQTVVESHAVTKNLHRAERTGNGDDGIKSEIREYIGRGSV
jgi:hypothetical protein